MSKFVLTINNIKFLEMLESSDLAHALFPNDILSENCEMDDTYGSSIKWESYELEWLTEGMEKVKNSIEERKQKIQTYQNNIVFLQKCTNLDIGKLIEKYNDYNESIKYNEESLQEDYILYGHLDLIDTIYRCPHYNAETEKYEQISIKYAKLYS